MVEGSQRCRGSHLKPCVRPLQTNNRARGLGLRDLRPSSSCGPSALPQMWDCPAPQGWLPPGAS